MLLDVCSFSRLSFYWRLAHSVLFFRWCWTASLRTALRDSSHRQEWSLYPSLYALHHHLRTNSSRRQFRKPPGPSFSARLLVQPLPCYRSRLHRRPGKSFPPKAGTLLPKLQSLTISGSNFDVCCLHVFMDRRLLLGSSHRPSHFIIRRKC